MTVVDTARPEAAPTIPTTPPKRRTWKTWQLVAVGVAGLVLGGVAGGGNDTKTKELEAELAATQTKAAQDVAAAEQRADSAEASARSKIEQDYAAQKAELDKRAAELDQKDQELVKREEAVGIRQAEIDANSFGSGIHEVGTDIKPGTYKAADARSGCYWAKLGTGEDIIDNHFAGEAGPITITIEPTVKRFETNDCGTWVKVR